MTDEDVAHVSTMIVKAFVSAIDERFATPMVRFVPVSPSADSTLLRVLDGLLVDRPPPRVNDISPPPPHEGLSVALFSASLAGDWEGAERELALRQASVQVEGTRARLEPALLARLLHIADSLVHCGCRLVAYVVTHLFVKFSTASLSMVVLNVGAKSAFIRACASDWCTPG